MVVNKWPKADRLGQSHEWRWMLRCVEIMKLYYVEQVSIDKPQTYFEPDWIGAQISVRSSQQLDESSSLKFEY